MKKRDEGPVVYVLKSALDDPRFRGFESDERVFDSVVRPRTSRELKIRRLADGWVPPRVTGKVPAINHYPCINLSYSAFSAHAARCLKDLLESNGELLPLDTKSGEYFYYNLTTVADVLDVERSTIEWLKEPIHAAFINRHEFKTDRLSSLSIFRIPESSSTVYVTNRFVKRAFESELTGLCFYRVWPVPKGHDWKKKSVKPIMVDPSPGSAMTVRKAKAQSVRVTLELTRPEGSERERTRLGQLEEELVEVAERDAGHGFPVGCLESTEFADGRCCILFSCPDAGALVDRLRAPLKALNWRRPVSIVQRKGSFDDVEAVEMPVGL